MISHVTGDVIAVSSDHIEVLLGPVGFSVQVPASLAVSLKVGENVSLSTTMVVREDSITLYGFADPIGRDDFLTLLSVSGIGPRLALAIVSTMSPEQLRSAISTGNLAALTSISGVGKKGAERLVVELRDKLSPVAAATMGGTASTGSHAWQDQVRSALLGLGWTARDAQSAVESVAVLEFEDGGAAAEQPTAALLRAALRSLDRS